MILVVAVLAGLAAGLCRAWLGKRKYRIYELKFPVLVLAAFLPQYIAFFAPKARENLSNSIVAILLLGSLVLLLGFSILNIKKPGFWPICVGFLLNFLVILLNGGFMPMSPETAAKITQGMSSVWEVGKRFGYSKDMVLESEKTKLAFLSDRFTLTGIFGYNVAFSLGDIFIAVGVIWLLWMLGGEPKTDTKERGNE